MLQLNIEVLRGLCYKSSVQNNVNWSDFVVSGNKMTVFNNQATITLGGRKDSKGSIFDGFQGTVSGTGLLYSSSMTYNPYTHVLNLHFTF